MFGKNGQIKKLTLTRIIAFCVKKIGEPLMQKKFG